MANIYVDLINGEIPAIPFATGKIFDTEPNIDKTKIPVDTETTDTNDNIDEKIASDNFITPTEYYNKNSEGTQGSAEKDKQGYYNANGTNTNIEIKIIANSTKIVKTIPAKNGFMYIYYSSLSFNPLTIFG